MAPACRGVTLLLGFLGDANDHSARRVGWQAVFGFDMLSNWRTYWIIARDDEEFSDHGFRGRGGVGVGWWWDGGWGVGWVWGGYGVGWWLGGWVGLVAPPHIACGSAAGRDVCRPPKRGLDPDPNQNSKDINVSSVWRRTVIDPAPENPSRQFEIVTAHRASPGTGSESLKALSQADGAFLFLKDYILGERNNGAVERGDAETGAVGAFHDLGLPRG